MRQHALWFLLSTACSGAANHAAVEGVLAAALSSDARTTCQSGPLHGLDCRTEPDPRAETVHRLEGVEDGTTERRDVPEPAMCDDCAHSGKAPRTSAPPATRAAPASNGEAPNLWAALASRLTMVRAKCTSPATPESSEDIRVLVGLRFDDSSSVSSVEVQLFHVRGASWMARRAGDHPLTTQLLPARVPIESSDALELVRCIRPAFDDPTLPRAAPSPRQISFEFTLPKRSPP
jgi:hypothetical protein